MGGRDAGEWNKEGKGKRREERGTYLGTGAVGAVASAVRRGRGGGALRGRVGCSSGALPALRLRTLCC